MKIFQKTKRVLIVIGSTAAATAISISTASATLVSDATAAVTAAGADGLTVGGGVVAAVAGLAVVGVVIAIVRKI
ncbi:hypothetical protein B0F88_1054 [Methylobacter tundripaludum]|uniref:Virion coat protein B n=1 Tax=Methylobacter tundripaludum TaxID=173365 RepID=A0A2S6H322_9GAMM|nr:hypothetical protein [Methylobacter tundripaludum]PPK71892.1 hypothetical protein B0F88_1054 [Methylobacter tundripaludum]